MLMVKLIVNNDGHIWHELFATKIYENINYYLTISTCNIESINVVSIKEEELSDYMYREAFNCYCKRVK